ncbi:MAG: Lipoprotein signal peptidase [Actinomycetia bacterium]|nr:Lipoprotein signal peptidase [Actinomycetes bacterium]
MNAPRSRAALTLFVTAFLAYGLDRVTKILAESSLPGSPVELVPGVLTLRFTTNSGGAFSIGQSAPWFFVGVSVVVAVIILATAFRHTSRLVGASLGLVLGGALGNLTDRAIRAPGMRGHVVDFIDFQIWPVFNLADTAIVVGAILLAWTGLRERREESEPARAER